MVTEEALNFLLNLVLELLQGLGYVTGHLADLVWDFNLGGWCLRNLETALVDDVGVVGLATSVPGEDVGSAAGDIGESSLSGNRDEVALELLRSDVCNSIGRVLGWLERQHVGEETSNMRRCHGGTGDGVDGVLAADPGRLDVETGSKDVVALAEVGEVGSLVSKSAGANSDGILSGGWGVVARVRIVVASCDSEVNARVDCSVDGLVEEGGLATTQAHVGRGTLEALSLTLLSDRDLLCVRLSGVLDALDDVRHGSGSVGSQHLDGLDVSFLRNTVLLSSDSTRAVSAVSVTILISVASRDGLAPGSAALEVDVVGVGTGVDDVNINALAAFSRVQVFVKGAE